MGVWGGEKLVRSHIGPAKSGAVVEDRSPVVGAGFAADGHRHSSRTTSFSRSQSDTGALSMHDEVLLACLSSCEPQRAGEKTGQKQERDAVVSACNPIFLDNGWLPHFGGHDELRPGIGERNGPEIDFKP